MKLFLVAIYDKRAAEYSPPQVYITLGVAERAFQDGINTKGSQLNNHPSDFNLQHIGQYDSETAIVSDQGHPQIIAEANALIEQKLP